MEDLTKAKAAVDSIVQRIETRFNKFNVSEIWKAGSLGHGTVVPGHYDIDLVLYSRDIAARDVLRQNGFHTWTRLLEVFVNTEFGINTKTPGRYSRSVQFTWPYNGIKLSVDLLASPYWETPREFYSFLRGIPGDKRSMFTVCASKWQIQHFQKVDSKAKEYIRRAKAWRNKVWESGKPGKPSSYLMSLLVLRAYERANRYVGAGDRDVTRELISLVKQYPIDLYWEGENYRLAHYGDLVPARPRVIDPANPANNVWEGGFNGDPSDMLIRNIGSIDLSVTV